MFYEESGVEYWMAQFFDSTGSETTTILDNHSFHPMDALPKIAQPLLSPAPSESVSCRSLYVLSSSSPSLPFHTLLQQDVHSTFLAVSTTYLCNQANQKGMGDALQPPADAACEVLLRYSPQSYQSMLLDADRFYEEVTCVQANLQGRGWSSLHPDLLSTPLDYVDTIYQAALKSDSSEHALTIVRDLLYAIPTLETTPLLMEGLESPLTVLVQRGLGVIQAMMASKADGPTTIQQVQAWCKEVDRCDDLLQRVWLHGYHSLGVRLTKALTLRSIPESLIPLVSREEWVMEKEAHWFQSLEKCIRLYGSLNLIETSVRIVFIIIIIIIILTILLNE